MAATNARADHVTKRWFPRPITGNSRSYGKGVPRWTCTSTARQLVTGASKGTGPATHALAEAGAHVIAGART
jgi:hypothetical protein